MNVSVDYYIQKFYQLSAHTKYNRITQTYNGACPLCREGKSFGKKKRLFYIVKTNRVYCHNCGFSGDPIKFIQQVTGQSYKEIMDESRSYDLLPRELSLSTAVASVSAAIPQTLPRDCINLFDPAQVKYYQNNNTVKAVLEYMRMRRLDTAQFRPATLWLSLTDYVHKNRLVIPFYDDANQIVFYQSRQVFPNTEDYELPKYLSKVNGDKTLFNLNKVTPDLDKLFLLEGPINAFFVQNGLAVAGIQDESECTLTDTQRSQLSRYFTYERIWCLDSQWLDAASYKKTHILVENGHKVFIWPENYGKIFKDFNDMAMRLKLDNIPVNFIIKNAHSDLRARVALSQVKLLT